MPEPIVAVVMHHHVAEVGWWLRVIVACTMLGMAVALKHRCEMSFVSAVMSFVGLVALPSVATWAGVVDGAFHSPVRTLGGAVIMMALLFLVPFLIGMVAGESAVNDAGSLLHPDNEEADTVTNSSRDMGYVLTAVAVLSVLVIDTVPQHITNVLMSLLVVPIVMGAARLGTSVVNPEKKRKRPTGQEISVRTLTTLFGIFLIIVLLCLRRSAMPAAIPSVPLESMLHDAS
jgi:hypothetical protein